MKQDKPLLLVTGGAGYIGSYLVKQALAAGYRLHVLDSGMLPEDAALAEALRQGTLRLFSGSITESAPVRQSLQGVDHIVHLAGVSDGRAGKADPELTRKVNTESIGQLLEMAEAAGVKRFIFASTMGVYGNAYRKPLTEDLAPAPADPYSESKAIGEQKVQQMAGKICTTSLRIAMVYGAGLRIREDFLVNKLCQTAVQKGSLSLVGGQQQRPQIHLDDLAALIIHLLDADPVVINGQVFNAVESNPSLEEIAGIIAQVLPDIKIQSLPSRENEDSFAMAEGKLKKATGFVPRITLRDGIGQTIRYYQNIEKAGV